MSANEKPVHGGYPGEPRLPGIEVTYLEDEHGLVSGVPDAAKRDCVARDACRWPACACLPRPVEKRPQVFNPMAAWPFKPLADARICPRELLAEAIRHMEQFGIPDPRVHLLVSQAIDALPAIDGR